MKKSQELMQEEINQEREQNKGMERIALIVIKIMGWAFIFMGVTLLLTILGAILGIILIIVGILVLKFGVKFFKKSFDMKTLELDRRQAILDESQG